MKDWLEVENYYWMIKRFLIFDVDKSLNVYVTHLKGNELMEDYHLNSENIRFMAEEINPKLINLNKEGK